MIDVDGGLSGCFTPSLINFRMLKTRVQFSTYQDAWSHATLRNTSRHHRNLALFLCCIKSKLLLRPLRCCHWQSIQPMGTTSVLSAFGWLRQIPQFRPRWPEYHFLGSHKMLTISEQSKWQKLPSPSRSCIIFDASEQLLGVFVSLDLPCGRVWWKSWFVSWRLLHVPVGRAQDIHSLHLAMCSIQELSKIKFYATRLEAKIKLYVKHFFHISKWGPLL